MMAALGGRRRGEANDGGKPNRQVDGPKSRFMVNSISRSESRPGRLDFATRLFAALSVA
jgi:hypothetical protein